MNDNKNYGLNINGEWINSVSGETFPSDNPAKPEHILARAFTSIILRDCRGLKST